MEVHLITTTIASSFWFVLLALGVMIWTAHRWKQVKELVEKRLGIRPEFPPRDHKSRSQPFQQQSQHEPPD
jgi:hypothetical protein